MTVHHAVGRTAVPRSGHSSLALLVAILTGCNSSPDVTGPAAPKGFPVLALANAQTITAIDLSAGTSNGDAAHSISGTGIILGGLNGGRGWWQAPSTVFTRIDMRYLQGGNRIGDAAGSQNSVILATNGGAPWTNVTPLMPPGISGVVARDINDSRVVVGNTLGSNVYAVLDPDGAAPAGCVVSHQPAERLRDQQLRTDRGLRQ
jgi:hypothetical protein